MLDRIRDWARGKVRGLLYTTDSDSHLGSPVLVVRIRSRIDLTSGAMSSLLTTFSQLNPRVFSAVIVSINSAGGDLSTAMTIRNWIKTLFHDKGIPVVVVVEERCLSAGLVVLSSSESRFCQPMSMLGLFGVKLTWGEAAQTATEANEQPKPETTTKFKDVSLSDLVPGTDQSEMVKAFLQDLHDQFEQDLRGAVPDGDSLMNVLGDGRLISGREALDLGLVTRSGGMPEAIAYLREHGHINAHAPDLCYVGNT